MSVTVTYNRNLTIAGRNFGSNLSFTEDSTPSRSITLAANHAHNTGTLSTRTDNDTGTCTLGANHTFTDADRVDAYWTESGVEGRRYGMAVGTVSGTSVPIDGGSGDNLPSQDNAITLALSTEHAIEIEGDNIQILAVSNSNANSRVVCMFASAADADLGEITIKPQDAYVWYTGSPHINLLAGDSVDSVFLSNPDTATATIQVAALTS